MPSLRTGRPRPSAMESTPRQSPPGSGTVEVLYLLSRGAKLEHPHMINVHYDVHQPGPTLRDLKARLIALRGKGMPDSFSWSYKRDYKDTFIWCDLFNDDLILPLSGSGEYVLKATKLFDVAPQADGELEYEDFPPIRYSSPSKSSSERHSSRPGEHLDHVEDDVSTAIKKGLLLINVPPAADITSESSMGHLNKQIMNNLSNSEHRAPEVICSFDHSDVSSSGTFASFGGTQSKIKRSRSKSSSGARTETRTNSSSRTGTSDSPEVANQENQCSAASQTAHKELDVTNLELPTIKKGEMTSTSLLRMRTPGSEGRARRRSSVKEIEKSTIYTQFVCHKNGSDADKPQGRSPYSGSNSGDDPFLYGVLRKATRLGSNFKPRLCRGVDVVDSTRTKRKVHCRRKANGECRVKQARSVVSEPSSRKSTTVSPIKVTGSYSCFTSPEKPNIKGFKTLSHESFERTNSNSPTPVDKLINEPHPSSIEDHTPRPSTQLGLAQEDSSATDLPRESDLPRLPFGNDSMEVVPTSRGACRVHTMPQREGLKCVRSESKGNKQEVKLDSKSSSKVSSASNSRQAAPKPSYEHDDLLHHACSVHGMDDPMVVSTPEVSARNVNLASKQRKPLVKKASVTSFDASSVRAKATGKGSDERTVKAPRNASKESASKLQLTIVEDSTKQLPESFAFDSRALRSGNKQGLKMATQVPATKIEVKASAEATPKINSSEGSRRCPFEPPARPRDFKSREDRPLIPGLSSKDWERSLQEACRHSEPPTNLVLHECPQCGRTFKLESLQVHMRGCHAVSKPKPSSATQRRISL